MLQKALAVGQQEKTGDGSNKNQQTGQQQTGGRNLMSDHSYSENYYYDYSDTSLLIVAMKVFILSRCLKTTFSKPSL